MCMLNIISLIITRWSSEPWGRCTTYSGPEEEDPLLSIQDKFNELEHEVAMNWQFITQTQADSQMTIEIARAMASAGS